MGNMIKMYCEMFEFIAWLKDSGCGLFTACRHTRCCSRMCSFDLDCRDASYDNSEAGLGRRRTISPLIRARSHSECPPTMRKFAVDLLDRKDTSNADSDRLMIAVIRDLGNACDQFEQ